MTREEAVEILVNYAPLDRSGYESSCWLDAFEKLGMLKFDRPQNARNTESILMAIAQLENKNVVVQDPFSSCVGALLTRSGATQIVDILTKAGFRITRDPQ